MTSSVLFLLLARSRVRAPDRHDVDWRGLDVSGGLVLFGGRVELLEVAYDAVSKPIPMVSTRTFPRGCRREDSQGEDSEELGERKEEVEARPGAGRERVGEVDRRVELVARDDELKSRAAVSLIEEKLVEEEGEQLTIMAEVHNIGMTWRTWRMWARPKAR